MEERLGEIHYKIVYEPAYQRLSITVLECKDLKNMDTFGKSDPFVRILLVPGKHLELKTRVIKNNLNPVFEEDFKSQVTKEEAKKLTVVFRVYDWDHLGKSDEIGEAQVPLWKLNLFEVTDEWLVLGKFSGTKEKPVLRVGRPL